MGQQTWISQQVPILSWLGNRLIGSRFILTPQFYSCCLRNVVSQFNQALFLLCLRIVDRDDTCFTHAQSRTGPTPGAAASEDVACLMQGAADGAGTDTRQRSAQGPLQQFERPGSTLILLSIRGTV